MILGPILKKMKDEKEAKKRPLANRSEAEQEAPGLRVGKGSWKWPAVWPYGKDFLLTTAEAQAQARKQSLSGMAGLLGGGANSPLGAPPGMGDGTDPSAVGTATATAEEEEDDDAFKPKDFWAKQESTAFPMDAEAAEKLAAHFQYYLRDGMSILEFGAGADSYLGDLKPSKHVGVSLNPDEMASNPSLTDRLVVDLNDVVPDRDVNSDELRALAPEPFDAVIMTNTIPFLTKPREVYRTAWHLLKPGGIMMIAFPCKAATDDFFADAQTVMWRQYNDDQHIWITGSFFEFSAGDGWERLLGFDVSPESAKDFTDDNPLTKVFAKGKDNNMFVVQATKAYQDDSIDPSNPEKYINSQTWMLPVLEGRDKQLVVPRLARAYKTTESEEVREAIRRNTQLLPKIYEALIKMDQFAFTFSMQAQMAADLVCDPDFNGSERQILAMKEGLGLRKPGPDFWLPVGQNTAAMEVGDKVNLLAYIVPRFGLIDENPAQEEALKAFVSGLKPTYELIKSKCPGMSESDVQLLGTELLASEVLTVGRSTREEYAAWLNALSESELREILAKRKSYAETAKVELKEYKMGREEEKKRIEDYRTRMNDQVAQAREIRTMIFNPRTQKMEVFDNPNLKKKEGGFLGGLFGGGDGDEKK